MLVAASLGVAVLAAGLALVVTWRRRRPAWMGLEGRTLWDWTQLLLEATLIGVATIAITATQQAVEDNRAASVAVQQYLDRVTALVVDVDAADEVVRPLVVAHTSEVLRVTSAAGSGRVLAFLDRLGLLGEVSLDLEGLDLSRAELKGVDLSRADLEEASFAGADLEGADLVGADLEQVDLRGTDLKLADLRGATFAGARLARADLAGADLRGADLRGARGLRSSQLEMACLDEAARLPSDVTATPDGPGCDRSLVLD